MSFVSAALWCAREKAIRAGDLEMLKEKNLVARYVVHFIGYGAYVIRNRNQVRDICGIVDFQRNSVEIQASDGPLLHTALSDISSFGNSIGRMPYRDYVLYLMARNQVGPYGINIHGVQLWSPRDMKYFAVNKAVDARFFKGRNWQNRQIPGSSISA